jgi:hypothetical protein
MGTMRLVVDARNQGRPAEASIDRLSELETYRDLDVNVFHAFNRLG